MIRAEHIIKSFEGRTVLKDISATFETGKTNLIIGQSGSGKTVLLKSLVGLHTIDSGKIFYDDVCYTTLSFKERKAIRQQIGMIFQGGALLDSSTVEENVRLPLDLFTDQSASEKADRVNFCLQGEPAGCESSLSRRTEWRYDQTCSHCPCHSHESEIPLL